MKKGLVILLAAAMVLTALAGCAQEGKSTEIGTDGKLSVVTTIFPAYDFARGAAGDLADVTMLIKPGAEVHSFDPTPADIIAIQECDVFVYIGGESEAWVDTVLSSTDMTGKTVIRLMDFVTPVEEETVEGMQEEEHAEDEEPAEDVEHGEEVEYDEHVWTSPANAAQMVEAVGDGFAAADSVNADGYKTNAKEYADQIREVDAQIAAVVEAAPRKLILVADRFPFRYMVEEFGLDYYAAFSGCSAESDVTAGTMAFLIDKVEEYDIQYVYYIELSNQQVAKAVCEATGAQMLLLHSCHNVTKDEFEAGETYLSLMQNNVEALRKGLN